MLNNKNRACPLCNSHKHSILYEQKYSTHFSHNISLCKKCGFVFVSNAPEQKYYAEYYKNQSKYEEIRDSLFHEKSYSYLRNLLNKKLNKESAILDIGCATGHLLSILQKEGYSNIEGFDPSPVCKKAAKTLYDLEITTSTLEDFRTDKKYDLIILSAVLEHIVDLKGALIKINDLLTPTGYVYVAVPDIGKAYINVTEPFGEFSIEHINFFTTEFLYRYMTGYKKIFMTQKEKAILSVWQRGSDIESASLKYIKVSTAKLNKIQQQINSLPPKVIVWGAGSLTQRLLRTTSLAEKAILLIDKDKHLTGKNMQGISIIHPESLDRHLEPIFISSFKFKEEIIEEIKIMKLKNQIFTII